MTTITTTPQLGAPCLWYVEGCSTPEPTSGITIFDDGSWLNHDTGETGECENGYAPDAPECWTTTTIVPPPPAPTTLPPTGFDPFVPLVLGVAALMAGVSLMLHRHIARDRKARGL